MQFLLFVFMINVGAKDNSVGSFIFVQLVKIDSFWKDN